MTMHRRLMLYTFERATYHTLRHAQPYFNATMPQPGLASFIRQGMIYSRAHKKILICDYLSSRQISSCRLHALAADELRVSCLAVTSLASAMRGDGPPHC